MAKGKVETAVPCCFAKQKSRLTISSVDAPALKGKAVGDSCSLEIAGKIIESRVPDSYEKPVKGEVKYVIEVDKVENYKKRV